MTDKIVTAAVLVIGNEILSGRTRDTNLAWLAGELTKLGIRLVEARVVADTQGAIVAAVCDLKEKYNYIFTTGGIGPTHDDITAEAVARAFDVPLVRHPEAVRRLEAHYATPTDLNEARLRMANVPDGAVLIDNPISKAPGFRIGNVHVMAGVPAIMQAMFDGLRSELVGGPKMLARTIDVDLAEGVMAAELAAIQSAAPEVEIGSYPRMRQGRPSAAIVLRSIDVAALGRAADAVLAMMRGLGGAPRDDGSAPA
jgi:molybdenum cofactor synthesis domain-containing protein